MTLADVIRGKTVRVRILILLNELHVKALSQVGSHHEYGCLSKSFAKASAFAAVVGCQTHRMAHLSVWCQVKWVIRIKTLWQELVWTLPLRWIRV